MSSYNNRLSTPIVFHRRTKELVFRGHHLMVERRGRTIDSMRVKPVISRATKN